MSGIYIVGMPRSGTTLVQSIIATSPLVYTLPETHLYATAKPIFKQSSSYIRKTLVSVKLAHRLASLGLNPTIFASSGEQVVKTVHNKLLTRAHAEGKKYYLEKTPSHLYFVNSIHSAQVDAKFVFVVRRMLPNASSYNQAASHWEKTTDESDFSSAIARWYHDTILCQLRCTEVGGHIVQYDNLLELDHRANEIEKLERYLGFELSCEPNRLKSAATGIVLKSEHWKSRNLQGEIRASGTSSPSLAGNENKIVKLLYEVSEQILSSQLTD